MISLTIDPPVAQHGRIDPTRLRPSSEALQFVLPVGLHDLGPVHGALTLRRGEPIEMFEAIGKSYYSVEGRLVLADETGPCGTPTSDSVRTMVTEATVRCLMVIYAPGTLPAERMEEHVRAAVLP